MNAFPTYRFHGALKPERRSVLNFQPEPLPAEPGVAVLRLYDPIDSWGDVWGVSAKEFVAAVDALPADTTEIRVHINSPGGEVFEAVTILNAVRRHSAKFTAIVDGLAASAASFLAAGADETVMAANSTLMIHDTWGICIGNAEDMRSTAYVLDQLSDSVASIYAVKTGGTTEEWRAAMRSESWYTAEDAVAAGLADRVEEAPTAPVNSFDLSIFKAEHREPPAGVAELEKRDQGPDPRSTEVRARYERRHALNARRPESRRQA